jgi:predicted site-specific integrase-resolvase
MNDKAFVSIREASAITGIESQTLRKLADTQKLPSYKTPSGQRKFHKAGLEEMCNTFVTNSSLPKASKQNFIYTRVSSKRQMDDLSRQVEYVKSRRPEYASYTTVSDVGSGINFKRKGLSTILDTCLLGSVGEIVVAHRDRLSRFGFDLIELIVIKSGGRITVLDDQRNKSSEQELSEDLLSIVHIYSCRQMGKRSYKTRRNQGPENQADTHS